MVTIGMDIAPSVGSDHRSVTQTQVILPENSGRRGGSQSPEQGELVHDHGYALDVVEISDMARHLLILSQINEQLDVLWHGEMTQNNVATIRTQALDLLEDHGVLNRDITVTLTSNLHGQPNIHLEYR